MTKKTTVTVTPNAIPTAITSAIAADIAAVEMDCLESVSMLENLLSYHGIEVEAAA